MTQYYISFVESLYILTKSCALRTKLDSLLSLGSPTNLYLILIIPTGYQNHKDCF